MVFFTSLEQLDAARRALTGFASKVTSVAAAMASTLAMLACRVLGWVVTKLGPGSNVGTVVLLASDDAALRLDCNLFCTYSLKFYILEWKIRIFC